jgi:hypothetical protein
MEDAKRASARGVGMNKCREKWRYGKEGKERGYPGMEEGNEEEGKSISPNSGPACSTKQKERKKARLPIFTQIPPGARIRCIILK